MVVVVVVVSVVKGKMGRTNTPHNLSRFNANDDEGKVSVFVVEHLVLRYGLYEGSLVRLEFGFQYEHRTHLPRLVNESIRSRPLRQTHQLRRFLR